MSRMGFRAFCRVCLVFETDGCKASKVQDLEFRLLGLTLNPRP